MEVKIYHSLSKYQVSIIKYTRFSGAGNKMKSISQEISRISCLRPLSHLILPLHENRETTEWKENDKV